MTDVCLAALPYLIGGAVLVLTLTTAWDFFKGLVRD